MYKNYLCKKCEDTGVVGFIFMRECPVCHGDPCAYANKQKNKVSPPPSSRSNAVIEIKLENIEVFKKSNPHSRFLNDYNRRKT